MKKIFILLIILISVVSGCSCFNLDDDSYVKTSIFSSYIRGYKNYSSDSIVLVEPFGTYISLVGYNEKKVNNLQDDLDNMVTKYHSLLDRNYYYKDSDGNIINNIRVINDSYGSGNLITVDSIIIEILTEGIKYSKLSNGSFNIVSGSIVDVWDERFNSIDSSKRHVDPTSEEIEEAMKCVPSIDIIDQVIVIDSSNNTVRFNSFNGCEEGASITLGALAKSFFLDKLANEENFKKIGSSIYDAGQSSIIVRGDNPTRDSGNWNIAIKDSLNGEYAAQLQLNEDGAVSTSSGDNKGYTNIDGIRRHHIIDATSGYPNTYLLAATVVGESAMIADIVTTTLMTMSNLADIKSYLSDLTERDIDLKVLLQIKDNSQLKVLINDAMADCVKDISESDVNIVMERFSYGA